jgi:hypothetical protein
MEAEDQQKLIATACAVKKRYRESNERLDRANRLLDRADKEILTGKGLHIATLGRLSKYESNIYLEALDYAEKEDMFIHCNSSIVGIKTTIDYYTPKSGKKFLAHFTLYGHYLERCKTDNEEEKFYDGNFMYRNFKAKFDPHLRHGLKHFVRLEELFDFSSPPEPAESP